jgi:hypothetical protein
MIPRKRAKKAASKTTLTSPRFAAFVLLVAGVEAAAAAGITGVQVTPTVLQPNGTSSVTITGALPCASLQIDFGDGKKSTISAPAFPLKMPHTFTAAGTYTITVQGVSPCAGQASAHVTVSAPATPASSPLAPSLPAPAATPPPGVLKPPAAPRAGATQPVVVSLNPLEMTGLRGTAGSFQPVSLNLTDFTMTGLRGTAGSFQPVSLNLNDFTMTGLRAEAAVPFKPVALDLQPLTMTGIRQ